MPQPREHLPHTASYLMPFAIPHHQGEPSLLTWAPIHYSKPPSTWASFSLCLGPSWLFLKSSWAPTLLYPPKERHWSGRKGEVTKGEEEELCTWFCCLYCTSVCGFATLFSLRVFIKWFKEFRNCITTTILRIFPSWRKIFSDQGWGRASERF